MNMRLLWQTGDHLSTSFPSSLRSPPSRPQGVYNWQYVHCVDLWCRVLAALPHESLRPLVYPLVQTTLGVIQLQPSPRFHPLRLHCLSSLLLLASSTDTFVPLAPPLLTVLEGAAVGGARARGGKPPNLSLMLHASKPQLLSGGYQVCGQQWLITRERGEV